MITYLSYNKIKKESPQRKRIKQISKNTEKFVEI